MIEQYGQHGDGYTPFLIRPGWQVAELSYVPALRFGAVERVERHLGTDEAFIALRGQPVLACAAFNANAESHYECVAMQALVTYNIPAGMWHTICLAAGDLVLIVEASNTHRNDVEYRTLSSHEMNVLNGAMQSRKESQ